MRERSLSQALRCAPKSCCWAPGPETRREQAEQSHGNTPESRPRVNSGTVVFLRRLGTTFESEMTFPFQDLKYLTSRFTRSLTPQKSTLREADSATLSPQKGSGHFARDPSCDTVRSSASLCRCLRPSRDTSTFRPRRSLAGPVCLAKDS